MTDAPLVYIAMPYRQGRFSQRENIARANEVGRYYAAQGMPVVVPHNISHDLDPFNRLGDDYWLSTTLRIMEGCDVIVLGPYWHESAGCRNERARAEEIGLDVWEMEEVVE